MLTVQNNTPELSYFVPYHSVAQIQNIVTRNNNVKNSYLLDFVTVLRTVYKTYFYK